MTHIGFMVKMDVPVPSRRCTSTTTVILKYHHNKQSWPTNHSAQIYTLAGLNWFHTHSCHGGRQGSCHGGHHCGCHGGGRDRHVMVAVIVTVMMVVVMMVVTSLSHLFNWLWCCGGRSKFCSPPTHPPTHQPQSASLEASQVCIGRV